MPAYRRLIAVLLQVMALMLAAPAQAEPTHIEASLVAEGPAAPGGTTTLAFVKKLEAGWHGYWLNPGDAGLGMRLEWSLPYGTSPGTLRYPVPQTLLISGLMNHVFEHDYALLVPLTLSPDATPGSRVPVRVKANWLACTEQICVPESAELETTVLVGTGTRDPRFDAWRAALPAPLGAKASFAFDAKSIRIGIPLPRNLALFGPHLFPETDHLIAYAAPQEFRRSGDMLMVTLKRPDLAAADPTEIKGVLRLNGAGDGVEFTAAPGAVPSGGELVADPAAKPPLSLPMLLFAALLGGLILNVMPCVFPILSLKALSLARAGESEAEARAEGLAYAAGVVLACAILGAVLLALRAAGQDVGWAFQLQEPGVVVALLLLAVAITANLAGLFEFAIPGFAGAANPKSAFATGLLAAFVATPLHRPVHGRRDGRGAAAASGRGHGAVRCAGPRHRPALPRRGLRSCAAPPAAEAGGMDGVVQEADGRSDGPDRARAAVAVLAARGNVVRRHVCLLRPRAGDRAGGHRTATARRQSRWLDARGATAADRSGRRRKAAQALQPAQAGHRVHPPLPALLGSGPHQSARQRQAGLRLLHRRLVFDLQGQRKRRHRARGNQGGVREGRRASAGRRLDKAKSGDHAVPDSAGGCGRAALPVVCAGQGCRAIAAGAFEQVVGGEGSALDNLSHPTHRLFQLGQRLRLQLVHPRDGDIDVDLH